MLLGLPKFEYIACETIQEACSMLSEYQGQAKFVAGGTDLLVKMKHRRILPRYLINAKKIPGLDYIRHDGEKGLRIGALTTIEDIKNAPIIIEKFPILHQAASKLGSTHIRNLGTLGGNLSNASPAAELAPALLTLEASVKIERLHGERVIPLETFFLGPGKSALQADEILTEVQVPNPSPFSEGVYLKHSIRPMDVGIVGVAVLVTVSEKTFQDIKIALGSVGPTPFRAKAAEGVMKGRALSEDLGEQIRRVARTASEEASPIDDIRARAGYRKKMVETLVKEAAETAINCPRF